MRRREEKRSEEKRREEKRRGEERREEKRRDEKRRGEERRGEEECWPGPAPQANKDCSALKTAWADEFKQREDQQPCGLVGGGEGRGGDGPEILNNTLTSDNTLTLHW